MQRSIFSPQSSVVGNTSGEENLRILVFFFLATNA
jgi:hypothetical protein